jgi:hypothetical protein
MKIEDTKTNSNALVELIRNAYGPFFPVSKKKKERFMEKVRDKVAFYKPMIEEKSDVDLGDVQVKDNKYWLSDVVYGGAPMLAVEIAWKNGKTPTELDYNLSFMMAGFSELIMFPTVWLYNALSGADFRYNNNILYVPFSYMNRFMDIDFKERTKNLDYAVVHELSHNLWEKLADGGLFERENYSWGEGRKWHEGFATYCADNYFAEFYPDGTDIDYRLPKVYKNGKEKIEEALAQHGKGILLEIPRRWKELN